MPLHRNGDLTEFGWVEAGSPACVNRLTIVVSFDWLSCVKNVNRNIQEKCVMGRVSRDGIRHQKNFSLRDFESWEAAEGAAGVWVKKKTRELPPPKTTRGIMNVRNTSGVVGVSIDVSVRKMQNGNEHLYPRWIARWPGCRLSGGLAIKIVYNGASESDFLKSELDAFVMAVLALEHEETDRTKLSGLYSSIKGRKKHRQILARRNEEGIRERLWESGIEVLSH